MHPKHGIMTILNLTTPNGWTFNPLCQIDVALIECVVVSEIDVTPLVATPSTSNTDSLSQGDYFENLRSPQYFTPPLFDRVCHHLCLEN